VRRAAVAWLLLGLGRAALAQPDFVTFESGPVRPLAIAPDASALYVTNLPDARLEFFALTDAGIVHAGAVSIGLEPVAVTVRKGGEIWVVNHLSDSVSIVDPASRRVTRTLLVGDEPRDIVITDPDGAGPLGERAFITTAHRGQQREDPSLAAVPGAGDPQLTTPGVGRADVWVFDAADPGPGFGGTPLAIVELFGDTPRALAVSPEGTTVYAAVFHSGNQTAVVNEGTVCDGFTLAAPCAGDGITSPGGLADGQLPGGLPGPATNHAGAPAPEVGLVVQFDPASGQWRGPTGRNWSNGIRFDLPDHDVFAIDAASLALLADFEHVGTILFNMVTNPVTGDLYVSNTEAQNLTRFEGAGVAGGSTVQGNLAQARITVIDPDDETVSPRHLNKHIDYALRPAPPSTAQHSLATPLGLTVSDDGNTLFVAAFGSGRIGVFDTGALEADSFDPNQTSANYLAVSGGGPAGLALDEGRNRLYVYTRFDNAVSVLDLASGQELTHVPFYNPEPRSVVQGRPVLYDAIATSSNGEASCAACHIFGDMDSLAWDLGDPDGDVTFNPQTIELEVGAGGAPSPINGTGITRDFHPMKGPMTTQTLRGMVNSGHMHWRGDRANGFFGIDDPDTGDARLSFLNFIVAFPGLLGDPRSPADAGLQEQIGHFADFALELTHPPNPIRRLDNALRDPADPNEPSELRGREFFVGDVGSGISDGINAPGLGFSCEGCHRLDPAAGFFGTGGAASFENETQIVKVPHLRNAYQKVGMFGAPAVEFVNPGDNQHQAAQVRGTGFLHDGAIDTLFRFLQGIVFNPITDLTLTPVGFQGGDPQRRDVEAFMLAFDSDLPPIVGQQITLGSGAPPATHDRVTLLIERAAAPFVSKLLGGETRECDLIVRGRVGGEPRGFLYEPDADHFVSDRAGEIPLDDAALRALAEQPGQELTYTCVPASSGHRAGLDRDRDGARDSDERDAGTDPGNPGSIVLACGDGLDNDGDGLIDLADGGCAGANASIENPQCNDGFDNDNDSLVDLVDPDCTAPSGVEFVPEPLGPGAALVMVAATAWLRSRQPVLGKSLAQ